MRFIAWIACASVLVPLTAASAATHQVGPSRTIKTLQGLPVLRAGDVIELDGDATYPAYSAQTAGAAGNPITLRGVRVAGKRPVISGGANNTLAIEADHWVVEGLEITGGAARCFYHHADDVVLRDSYVHDCPKQGILGADSDSGSLLLEYVEVTRAGGGTQDHQIYMATDNTRFPNAVFRMQFCWVHDGNGGNGVKSRAGRNEIYYNWIEGSLYHELELIGADGQPEAAVREDSDVVGNVLMKGGGHSSFYAVRAGGDGTGQSNGRFRFAHNTFIMAADSSGVFRLFDGIQSLQADNNVIWRVGGGAQVVVREVEASWVGGSTLITGANNWILTAGTGVPTGFTGSVRGATPMLVDVAGNDLRPATGSPLINAAAATTTAPAGAAIPNPLPVPLYMPSRAQLAPGTAVARPSVGAFDIGALEFGSGPPVMAPDGGVMPVVDGGRVVDSGVVLRDDAGNIIPAVDGGGSTGGGDDGGCGCQAGGRGRLPAGTLTIGIIALLALLGSAKSRKA